MINNKNQLKNKLKDNYKNIKLKRIYNIDKSNKIAEGSTAEVVHVQSNSFKVKYNNFEGEPWIYYDDIEVQNNKIIYYGFIPDYQKEAAEKEAAEKNIVLYELTEAENKKINNDKYKNYKYIYKYITIINEIIEEDQL